MRNVGIEVFPQELGMETELPAMERELAEELTRLALHPEVEAVLDTQAHWLDRSSGQTL